MNSMLVMISGPYPRSVLNVAINRIAAQDSESIQYLLGNVVDDAAFDLATSSQIATLVCAGLIAVRFLIEVPRKMKTDATVPAADVEAEIKKAVERLPQSEQARVSATVCTKSPGDTEIHVRVSSQIHLERIEITCHLLENGTRCEVTLGTIERGRP